MHTPFVTALHIWWIATHIYTTFASPATFHATSTTHRVPTTNISARSKIECSTMCLQDDVCDVFVYDGSSRSCRMYVVDPSVSVQTLQDDAESTGQGAYTHAGIQNTEYQTGLEKYALAASV